MATAGKGVVIESGKRGVLPSGKLAIFNSAGACPCCCGAPTLYATPAGWYGNSAIVDDEYVVLVWDDQLNDYVPIDPPVLPDWDGLHTDTWNRYASGTQDWGYNDSIGLEYSTQGPYPQGWDSESIQGNYIGAGLLFKFDVAETDFGYDSATQELYDVKIRIPYSFSALTGWTKLQLAVWITDTAPPAGDNLHTVTNGGSNWDWMTVRGEDGTIEINRTESQVRPSTDELYLLVYPPFVNPGLPSETPAAATINAGAELVYRVRDK